MVLAVRHTPLRQRVRLLLGATGSAITRLAIGWRVSCAARLAAPAVIDRLVAQLALDGREQALAIDAGSGLMSAALRRSLTAGSIQHLVLERAETGELPFADDTFDLVASRLGLPGRADPARQTHHVQELVRVLRPGGRLLVVDANHTEHGTRMLVANGLCSAERHPGSPLTLPRLDVLTARKPLRS